MQKRSSHNFESGAPFGLRQELMENCKIGLTALVVFTVQVLCEPELSRHNRHDIQDSQSCGWLIEHLAPNSRLATIL
jgi:hypothetical protein